MSLKFWVGGRRWLCRKYHCSRVTKLSENNKDMSTQRRGICGTHSLGIAHVGFLVWNNTVLGPELAAVTWHQTELRQLVGLHLLSVEHSPMFLLHNVDAYHSRSPFSPVISNEFILFSSPLTASWVVGHKAPEGGKCGCKDILWSSSRDVLCNC